MKVHLVKEKTLRYYSRLNPQSKIAIQNWLTVLKAANWETPGDIVRDFSTADILGNGTSRVVFNLGGNKYRMVCSYAFGKSMVHLFICWVGTHKAYTDLCNKQQQYTISQY